MRLISEILDELAEWKEKQENLAVEKKTAIEKAFPQEVRNKIVEIESDFIEKELATNAKIAELEEDIRVAVLNTGSTIRGKTMMAVWSKGRVTWDSKVLEGMMVFVPELKSARKEGQPSVSIKKI
jgi:hypothetical protein